MLQGIETNDKKLKYKRKDDIEYLSKDLNGLRKTSEHFIDKKRPKDPYSYDGMVTDGLKQHMFFARVISTMLGIIGIFSLIYGLFSLIHNMLVLGLMGFAIGIVFVVSFILFELK